MTMRVRAVLLTMVFLSSGIIFPALQVHSVSAAQVSHFGNTGFPATVNVSFAAAGYDSTTNITIGQNAVVSSASFDVRGLPNANGESPFTIGVDIGDDGDREWGWGGPGNGTYGQLNEFSNGWGQIGVNLSNGTNTAYSIRLPADAFVNSATVNFSTLSQITLSGNDVRDAYLHKPNPTWGNVTHKDCNYGDSNLTLVGKSVWANWHIYRGVYWFNMSQLPAVTVLDANLSFWVENGVNHATSGQTVTANHTYTLYPLLKDWEEGQENNILVQNGPGVTWNNAIDNLTGSDYAWATAGAGGTTDRGSSVAAITNSPANLEQNWLNFHTQNLTSLVQAWVNGTTTNNGLLMTGDENTNKPDGSVLSIMGRKNSTHGPRLVVTFEGSDDITAAFDLGNDGSMEWNHSGNLSSGTISPDLSGVINSYLVNATPSFTDAWGNDFVDIPLNITGNATLVMSNLNVSYDWNPTVDITPNGDLANEINQHLANLTADVTGNVSIIINVTSGSPGVVKLSNLQINTGNRPPSIGAIGLPIETIVPDGQTYTVSLEVTCYQGLGNLSWVALTPQLQNSPTRPVLFYSLSNSSVWMNNPGGLVANLSGNWQELNGDTALMQWDLSADWAWPVEKEVVWLAQVGTIDSLNSDRTSSTTTDHERRVEIASFNLWDESAPSDGGPEVFTDEWVAGGDQLRISGTVNFLNLSTHPRPGDLTVELVNLSGNASVAQNGVFSINATAPNANHYDGFTVGAVIQGIYDATPAGFAERDFRIDATSAGLQVHSPVGARVIPEPQQLFNISIADTIGLNEGSLTLRWWVEAISDVNGDGIPQGSEYFTSPLLRQGTSDFFHTTYDDTNNVHGQLVSLFVEGTDLAGNSIPGGQPGLDVDLLHYISLVTSPTTLINTTLEMPGGMALVPENTVWLNLTLDDENWLEDLEEIIVDFGQGDELVWSAENASELLTNNPEIIVESFSLSESFGLNGSRQEIFMNISFSVSAFYSPTFDQGQFILRVTDSSGIAVLACGKSWYLAADIHLAEFSITRADDPLMSPLHNDSYVIQGQRLLFSGRVLYVAADVPPPSLSHVLSLQVPLDSPLVISIDDNGYFSATMDALGSGLYQVNLNVIIGPGQVVPSPSPLRIQVDDQPPTLVGSEPNFIATNSTEFILKVNIQENGAGLSGDDIGVFCQISRGIITTDEQFQANATLLLSGQVSSYLANLTIPPISAEESLDCWLEFSDLAGNNISGQGSSASWPLSIPAVETRPDLIATDFTISPAMPTLGIATTVNFTVINIGNQTEEIFWVSISTLVDHEGEFLYQEVANTSIRFVHGETSVIISQTWTPDWEGDFDLIFTVDSTGTLSERDENNSFIFPVSVGPAEPASGFFSSQNSLFIGGSALFLLMGAAIFLVMRLGDDDEYDDWEDEKEDRFEGEEVNNFEAFNDGVDSEQDYTTWREADGYLWRELPDGTNQWWDESGESWNDYDANQ